MIALPPIHFPTSVNKFLCFLHNLNMCRLYNCYKKDDYQLKKTGGRKQNISLESKTTNESFLILLLIKRKKREMEV